MNDVTANLNYIVYPTYKTFEAYGLSTREIPAKNLYCVIDIDDLRIVYSSSTKKMCIDYITKLTMRVTTHRKINNDQLH